MIEPLRGLGPSREHAREQLVVVGFDVGEQSDFLEDLVGERVRLVDDETGLAAAPDTLFERSCDFRQEAGLGSRRLVAQAESVSQMLKKLAPRQERIAHHQTVNTG